MRTECGIFGIINKVKNFQVVNQAIKGLNLLQHRGRESAGVAYFQKELVVNKKAGLVLDVFKDFKEVDADKCIGHVRYSTSGSKDLESIQPYRFITLEEDFALVYNGNIKNINRAFDKFSIREDIEIDTKMIIEILKKIDKKSIEEKLIEFMNHVNGVYCMIIMSKNGLYAIRDSFGVRPFCLARNKKGFCLSSESCAFQNYDYIRDIKPGEILFLDGEKTHTIYHLAREQTKKCIFEYIYFMNKESLVENKKLEYIRYEVGKKIGYADDLFDYENTLVCGCPQTGIAYGQAFAQSRSLRYKQFLKKEFINDRTFILPQNDDRIISIKKNLFIDGDIKDKDLVLLDDSLVRGNTMKNIISKLREHGARSVHVRITSPPVRFPCYFGVDIPTFDELLASKLTIEKIKDHIDADTLKYTSLDIFYEVLKDSNFCSACFDGQYKKELLDW